MTNAELISMVRSIAKHGADWRINEVLNRAADALEAADKRIAVVEEERDLERFAAKNYLDKIDELKAQLPKEGEWIDAEYDEYDLEFGRHQYFCSVCGKFADSFVGGSEEWWCRRKPNYCPNCGARMQTVTDCHTLEEGER